MSCLFLVQCTEFESTPYLVNAQGEEVFANKTHCHHQHNKVVIQKMANSPAQQYGNICKSSS